MIFGVISAMFGRDLARIAELEAGTLHGVFLDVNRSVFTHDFARG